MTYPWKTYGLQMAKILGISCIVICSAAKALSIQGWQLKLTTQTINNDFYNRYPFSFTDDMTSDRSIDQVKLTSQQEHQALTWNLSIAEEKRFVLLMHNKSGVYYLNKTLTPIDILGINARSNDERNNYAARAAQLEFLQTAKLLAYQAAYHQAAEAIMTTTQLPVIKDFNKKNFSAYHYQPLELAANDQLLLFIKKDDPVRAIMGTLLSVLSKAPKVQLNIYFVDHLITDHSIQQWANAQTIPVSWVNDKRITLNRNSSRYNLLALPNKTTPLLLLVRGNSSERIDIGRL